MFVKKVKYQSKKNGEQTYYYVCEKYYDKEKKRANDRMIRRLTPEEITEYKKDTFLVLENQTLKTPSVKAVIEVLPDTSEMSLATHMDLFELVDRCLFGDLQKKAFKGKRFALDYLVPLVWKES